ncbi:MAG: hypothetical protein KTR19_03410, partial [Hyphomicrobiales bacterium]|nr:hypothetical protein [Hyphomicrobiales bacterium]
MLDRTTIMDAKIDADSCASPGALLPVAVRGLTLNITGKPLINGMDLTLPAHTFTMIMGANGAGKSL